MTTGFGGSDVLSALVSAESSFAISLQSTSVAYRKELITFFKKWL